MQMDKDVFQWVDESFLDGHDETQDAWDDFVSDLLRDVDPDDTIHDDIDLLHLLDDHSSELTVLDFSDEYSDPLLDFDKQVLLEDDVLVLDYAA